MYNYIETTKLRKPLVRKPLNSIAFNEINKYSTICRGGKKQYMSFKSYKSPLSPMTKKTTTNRVKNKKFDRKVQEESVEVIKTISFYLKFISDQFISFSKLMVTVYIRVV